MAENFPNMVKEELTGPAPFTGLAEPALLRGLPAFLTLEARSHQGSSGACDFLSSLRSKGQ